MSEPIRHHYLPQGAHLRFFAIPGSEDRVFCYRRGSKPVEAGIRQIGAEKFLYSLLDNSGRRRHELESEVLASLDGPAQPVMAKLNSADGDLVLIPDEIDVLYDFVTFQVIRTPAFQHTLTQFDAELLGIDEAHFGVRAELRRMLPAASEEVVESLIRATLARVKKIVEHPNYWLNGIGRFADLTRLVLFQKSIELVVTDDEVIFTSDHPVARDYSLGLQDSDLVFPIGSSRVLLFRAHGQPSLRYDRLRLSVRRISSAQASRINQITIAHAEDMVIGAVRSSGVQRMLDDAARPQRMRPTRKVLTGVESF